VRRWVQEFREFIAMGNMLDLAVAVILGAAMKDVISAFTDGVVLQLIAAIAGEADFNDLAVHVGDTPILYGTLVTKFVNLLLVGFVLFTMVKAYNTFRRQPLPPTTGPSEVELLTEIRDALRDRA